MIVRPAVRQDAAGIYDIETESFSVPWSRESIDHELEHTELTRYYVLVRDDGYIAGYAGLWRVTDEGQITNIALGLYRKLGFEVLSVRKSYYSEPVEDAYVMGCQKEKYKWAVK